MGPCCSSAPTTDCSSPPPGQRAGAGHTFDGRDVFAPAAAHLAAGVPLERLGPPVDPASLAGEGVPEPATDPDVPGGLEACVLWVDRFGNAQLNLTAADLGGGRALVRLPAGEELDLPVAGSFTALGPGRPGLVVDSYGLLALCLDRASAAAAYGLAPGQRLRLRPGSVRPRE